MLDDEIAYVSQELDSEREFNCSPALNFFRHYTRSLKSVNVAIRGDVGQEVIDGIVERLPCVLPSSKEEPTTWVVIQTYKPSLLLLWTLDQLSRQVLSGRKFGVTIFHNGLENGSRIPLEIRDLAKQTGINIIDEERALGAHRALMEAMCRAFEMGRVGEYFFHMDDDTGPISPYWVHNAIEGFKNNPQIGALFFPALYYGRENQNMLPLVAYKAITLTAQAIKLHLGSPHITDAMGGYRTEALLPLLRRDTDLQSLKSVQERVGVVTSRGYEVTQQMSIDSLFFTDPTRILERGGLLNHLVNTAGMQSRITSRRAVGRWRKMYDDNEI